MADFSSLKQTILAYIKQNGNEEITGNILQDVLLAMVSTMGDSAINGLASALQDEINARQNQDSTLQGNITAEATARQQADTALGGRIDGLQTVINGINTKLAEGYIYAGIATPSTNPGTPSGKVFYVAVSSGTYTNFSNLTAAQGINILKYNGSAWSKDVVYAIDARPKKNSQNLVASGGIFDNMGALDVSELNATENPHTLAKYVDLSAALAAIPTDYQKGGMSIKFVQSSDNKYVQARCMAQNFTTDVTQWAIADEGVYVENPEFIYVKTDAEGKILWAIKADGGIYYGAGAPQQIIDYVTEKIAELKLTNVPDIIAFLGNLCDKQPIFSNKKVSIIGDSISTFTGYLPDGYPSWYPHENDRSSDVVSVNDTWWKKLIDATDSTLDVNASWSGSKVTESINGPSFDERVDAIGTPDVILIALGTNDSVYNIEIGEINFSASSYDLTKFAPAYIKGIKDTMSLHPNARIICLAFDMVEAYQNVIKTVATHYALDYIYVGDISDVHPNKAEMQAVYERIYNTWSLAGVFSNKVDKAEGKSLIDEDVASGVSYEECPEFMDVETDADGKILEAVEKDGTKLFGGNVKVLGSIDVSGVSYKVVTNPEWLKVVLDSEDRIICGIKPDGKFVVYVADFLDDIEVIKARLEELDIYSVTENPEFMEVELDAEDKVLCGRKTDGTKFENNDVELNSNATVGGSLEVNGVVFKNIEDLENRSEITTDTEGKIISYRKPDGTKVENVGIESPKIATDSLNLSESGMTEFQQALKDSGFQPGGGGNWSERDNIELPEPLNYALLNIVVDALPLSGTSEGYVEYYDCLGNFFKMGCSLEPQGQSTRIFAQTGGKGNYTLDLDKDVKIGSWVPQDSFHLKGNAKDCTRGILATSYKWAYLFMKYLDAKPNRVLMNEAAITNRFATGNRMTDWPSDARCLPDGFPVEVYVNGNYWGLYSWQLKKHRKNYSMDKKDYESFFIDADKMMEGSASTGYLHGFWDYGPGSYWTQFEVKNPKDLVCMDGTAYDGDHPKELIDSTSPYYDDKNKAMKGSAKTKSIIIAMSTKYLEIKSYIDNNNLVAAKEKFNEYFDYNACMLVYIYNCLMRNHDSIAKNTLWAVYKNGKIAPMLYDLDGMYGQGTYCDIFPATPTAYMWEGNYATSAWPLSLLWTLYEDEIKATYASLRRDNIISIDCWHKVMYDEWVNRIGEEAFNRDIKKWPETPSYRENYTNTEYWQQTTHVPSLGNYNVWDENTEYNTNDVVAIRLHSQSSYYMLYMAVQPSTGVCPVTKFYDNFPIVGGYYDSPKRFEKWMDEQILLCDVEIGYMEDIVADFTAYNSTYQDYTIRCTDMTLEHNLSSDHSYIEGHITRHEMEVEGQTVSIYTITNGKETDQDTSKTYTNVKTAVEAASQQIADIPSEDVFYIYARTKEKVFKWKDTK